MRDEGSRQAVAPVASIIPFFSRIYFAVSCHLNIAPTMSTITSMTGFAAVSCEVPGGRFALELKTVNHRYLEFQTRMPEDLRSLEQPMRELLAARLTRGKVDCRVTFTPIATRDSLAPNAEALTALVETQKQILNRFDAGRLSVWEIMHAPGVLSPEAMGTDAAKETLLSLFKTAIAELNATRQREGEKLAATINERLDGIESLVRQVTPLIPHMVAAYQEKLAQKLTEAMAGSASDERLKQEVVLFASRIDVSEELNRLTAHISEVRRVVKAGGAVGKRLDFLMQELNREANTLGSKSVSAESTKVAVELKVLIEQMREQIQNIE